MCWAEKCCYVIPANLGCVLLGIFSIVLSMGTWITALVFYIIENQKKSEGPINESSDANVHFGKSLGLDLNISSLHILLWIVMTVAALWMLFSILLIIGIVKNKPNFVLSYFSYGIIVTILSQLSALLLLIQNCWVLALILFIMSLIHIHFLVVVHTVYELMSRGKDFRLQQREDDEDPLAECFDGDLNRI